MKIHPLTPRAAILVTGCALLAAGLTAQEPAPAAPEALPGLPAPTAPSASPKPPTQPTTPTPTLDPTAKIPVSDAVFDDDESMPATPPSVTGASSAPSSGMPGLGGGAGPGWQEVYDYVKKSLDLAGLGGEAAPGSPSPAQRARALRDVDESWNASSGGGFGFTGEGAMAGRAGGSGDMAPGRPSSVRSARAVAGVALDEEVSANPQDAAHRYEAIIAGFDSQRAAAAQAVFRLGESYRRMGRVDEARVQFARILREFVDFPELAALSQQQLTQALPRPQPGSVYGTPPVYFGGSEAGGSPSAGGMASGYAPVTPRITPAPSDEAAAAVREEERALLQEEIGLLEEALSDVSQQFMSGVVSRSDVLSVQREILQLKRQLLHHNAHRAGGSTSKKNSPESTFEFEPAPAPAPHPNPLRYGPPAVRDSTHPPVENPKPGSTPSIQSR